MSIQTRQIGSLTVSALGLGCMGMSEFYGTPDEQSGIDTIHRALDLGVTFLDTADIEEIRTVARWGILDGVTTNPTLYSKVSNASYESILQEICKITPGPVSAEVVYELTTSFLTSWIFTAPVFFGRWASADSMVFIC